MKNTRFFGIVIVFCFALFFLLLNFIVGQDVPAKAVKEASTPEVADPLKIMVSVNEVRLDVVVLDKKGEPVTDLTAADFEVYQDGKRQEVTSSVYVDSQPYVAEQPVSIPNTPSTPLLSEAAPKKEDVHRTIIFVVDDYAMTFENGYYTKMALRKYIEKQMQPGDMVSILRTDYGNKHMNMFLSDKREVLARINAMPSTMAPRPGSEDTTGVGPAMYENFLIRRYEKQVSTLLFSFNALMDMPGRKILFMLSPFSVPDEPLLFDEHINNKYFASGLVASGVIFNEMSSISRSPTWAPIVENLFEKLSTEALRAGVVVNYVDVDGLYNYYTDASIWNAGNLKFKPGQSPADALLEKLQDPDFYTVEHPVTNPLPAQTGGVVIRGSNFFLDGLSKEAESLLRGYYLITYIPPSDTFKTRGKKDNNYRRLKVNVNRKDAVVHTRAGFFSKLESKPEAEAPKNSLIDAIYSPFKEDDINVNIATGYIKGDKESYLVRSWIHLDSKDIKIVETGDGGGRAALEAVFVTSDINGNIHDSNRVEFSLTNINTEWVKKHGIRFSMVLPVKKPGPYYIRIAVQDKETQKMGAAYQFLEISDLKKKGLALSSIFMLTSADDIQWMNTDVKMDVGQGMFFPMLQTEEVRSPALRVYKPGDNLMTLAMLYNADAKAISRSEIETRTILYKDGKEFLRGSTLPIDSAQVEDPGSIPLLNRLTVGSNLPPGDYVLQIAVTDKKNSKKEEGNASQFMSFSVTTED